MVAILSKPFLGRVYRGDDPLSHSLFLPKRPVTNPTPTHLCQIVSFLSPGFRRCMSCVKCDTKSTSRWSCWRWRIISLQVSVCHLITSLSYSLGRLAAKPTSVVQVSLVMASFLRAVFPCKCVSMRRSRMSSFRVSVPNLFCCSITSFFFPSGSLAAKSTSAVPVSLVMLSFLSAVFPCYKCVFRLRRRVRCSSSPGPLAAKSTSAVPVSLVMLSFLRAVFPCKFVSSLRRRMRSFRVSVPNPFCCLITSFSFSPGLLAMKSTSAVRVSLVVLSFLRAVFLCRCVLWLRRRIRCFRVSVSNPFLLLDNLVLFRSWPSRYESCLCGSSFPGYGELTEGCASLQVFVQVEEENKSFSSERTKPFLLLDNFFLFRSWPSCCESCLCGSSFPGHGELSECFVSLQAVQGFGEEDNNFLSSLFLLLLSWRACFDVYFWLGVSHGCVLHTWVSVLLINIVLSLDGSTRSYFGTTLARRQITCRSSTRLAIR